MNRVVLVGNLTRDPEARTTGTGISVATFTVAVSRRASRDAQDKTQRDADFISVVAWRATAENCAKYLKKGSKVAVSGSLQTRTYDAQDGTRRYVTEVIADEVEFLTRASGEHDAAPPPPPAFGEGLQPVEEDELPF